MNETVPEYPVTYSNRQKKSQSVCPVHDITSTRSNDALSKTRVNSTIVGKEEKVIGMLQRKKYKKLKNSLLKSCSP